VHIRELRPSFGAGFIVAVAGEILLMPGLGKTPAAFSIDVDDNGRISGMF
jgi:formate--tetrahydrofolate ligase